MGLLMTVRFGAVSAIFAVLLGFGSASAAGLEQSSASRYVLADSLTDARLAPLVLNERIVQHWTGQDGDFWFRRARKDGGEYVFVKASGSVELAFDHQRLASAVAAIAVSPAPVSPWSLVVTEISPGREATLSFGQATLVCSLVQYQCAARKVTALDPTWLLSPDGKKAAFTRGSDVWLHDLATGRESALTTDGEPYFAWGKYPEGGLLSVQRDTTGLSFKPWGFSWSPDSRYLIGGRIDDRNVPDYPLVESVPRDGSLRPKVHNIRIRLLGEKPDSFSPTLFDLDKGIRTPIAVPPVDILTPTMDVLGWSKDLSKFYTGGVKDQGKGGGLYEVSVATGQVRKLISEEAAGFGGDNAAIYNRPNTRIVAGGSQIIWFSKRSGWGHLYRYDLATGKLLNAVTKGNWLVRDIIQVDEARQRIYFTAGGREPGNPYRRRLYRVNFDGSGLTLLTPEDADHMIDGSPNPAFGAVFGNPPLAPMVSPNGTLFIDTYSTLDRRPVTLLRRTSDGGIISRIAEADDTALQAIGWRPPEPFTVKAADGVTDIYGVIYWPGTKPANAKIPVIDAAYGGPQIAISPVNFTDARVGYGVGLRVATASLGFAVVSVDGRATPLRSRAFHDMGYGNFADIALADHVAAIKQLGARYPQLDLDRVGIYGHSFGGYVATRALLRYPDFYKVAVASAGSQNFQGLYGINLPVPDYGNGVTLRPTPGAVPENYREIDNAALISNLKGHLLIAQGDLDENVYPAIALQFVDALIKADKSYDFLYLPNRNHRISAGGAYFQHRTWDYFLDHLGPASASAGARN